MKSDLINKVNEFLYKHLEESNQDTAAIKYRYEHTLRVTNIGIELSQKEGADEEIVALGCLLHDVGKFDCKNEKDHGRVSAKIAEKFLKEQNLGDNEIKDICYAIAVHVDGETSGISYSKG